MLALVLFAVATAAHASPQHALVIPQVAAAIQCDGELDEMAWRAPARTGAFAGADHAIASPYSDARFLRDDRNLYLALYAADENIRSTDHFTVTLGHTTLQFAANGSVEPRIAGLQVAVDRDGSIDDPTNDDEEWVIEAAIPLAALGFRSDGTIPYTITRCDVTKAGENRCGSASGVLQRR